MSRLGFQLHRPRSSWPGSVAEHYLSAIRRRLAVSFGLIVALLLLAFVAVTYLVVQHHESNLVTSQLMSEAHKKAASPDIAGIFKQTPQLRDEEEQVRAFLISPDGVLREADAVRKQAPDPGAVRRVLVGGSAEFTSDAGGGLSAYTMPVYRSGQLLGVVQTVTPTAPYSDLLQNLLLVSLIIGGLSLVAAALAALLMADRALRPIRLAVRRQQAFAQNAAHEFRAPLTVLRAAADLALFSDDASEMREALRIAVRESDHLSALAGDLRLLATADAGYIVTKPEPVDLAELVRDMAQEVRPVAINHDVHLETEAPPTLDITGDVQRLRQLLLILLDNAIIHTPKGGRIDIRLTQEGDRAQVQVRDTGSGIPSEHVPHIFERFYRADEARTRGEGGAGLGLAIAREIVEAHGGRIAVDSQAGGAVFTVDLPRS